MSHAEKDKLNAELYDKIDAMAIFIEKLEKRIGDLEGRLALNSKNSSKPPSQDPIANRPTRATKAPIHPAAKRATRATA